VEATPKREAFASVAKRANSEGEDQQDSSQCRTREIDVVADTVGLAPPHRAKHTERLRNVRRHDDEEEDRT